MTTTPPVALACSKCGKAMDADPYGGLCSACYSWKRHREDEFSGRGESLNQRQINWEKLCPEQYRLNDVTMIAAQPYEQVTRWRVNPHGLLCVGDSQHGKTTACWRLLEILYIMHSVVFIAVTEAEFSQKLSRTFRDAAGAGWLNQLCSVPVLFLDDIGHSPATSRHLEDLFFVVEKRTAWRKPMIVTTQFQADEWTSKAQTGAVKTIQAILNRLGRACSVVKF